MIQKGFDTVAAGYDHPSLSFFPETAKRLVDHLQLNPTDHLLDVCTGTGEAFSPMADIFIKCYESTGREVPPLSWKRLATEELIKEQFNTVGITKVDIHHEPLGYQMTDPQMWWDVVWNAGWRALLNQLSADEQKEFEVIHRKEIDEVLGDDGVWFNTEVLIAVGEK